MQEAKAKEESGTNSSTLPDTGRGNTQFASETAVATGQSKQHINRATQQAEHLQRRKEIWEAMQEAGNNTGADFSPMGEFATHGTVSTMHTENIGRRMLRTAAI